jgi:Holliday junction resolvasome RuvABC endonuclease subunit
MTPTHPVVIHEVPWADHSTFTTGTTTTMREIVGFVHQVHSLLDAIDRWMRQHSVRYSDVIVVIEDYIKQLDHTSRLFQLIEHATIAKLWLIQHKIPFELMNNQTNKKQFGGHGQSTKEQLWLALTAANPPIARAIESHFGWSYATISQRRLQQWSTRSASAAAKGKSLLSCLPNTDNAIPSPIQDLVDAFGLVSTWTLLNHF